VIEKEIANLFSHKKTEYYLKTAQIF